METPASEALIIGMNVFVFIIALSCALLLMTTVLDMSEAANEIITDTSDSSLLELYGEVEERVYTGYELLALSQKYNSVTTTDESSFNTSGLQDKYILHIEYEGDASSDKLENIAADDLTKKFTLEYEGKEVEEGNEKLKYVFKEVN